MEDLLVSDNIVNSTLYVIARSSHNESRRLLTLPCQPGACTSPCAPDVRPNAYSHVYQRRRRDPPPSNCTSDEEGWDGG